MSHKGFSHIGLSTRDLDPFGSLTAPRPTLSLAPIGHASSGSISARDRNSQASLSQGYSVFQKSPLPGQEGEGILRTERP